MTRLFIDGQEVVLPEQFELDFITENPYFTRNGEYTYDIDIDLRVPQNRQIYKNIDRADVTRQISNRKAVLLSGVYELIVGVEVILSIDDRFAKIQIVAGNSQLNYDGNTKIRDIHFDVVNYSRQEASQSLLGTYPTYKAVCTPVIYLETGSDYTRALNDLQIKDGLPDIIDDSEIVPQYYLAYITENLLSKLGFKKGINGIENNELWRRLFVVNSQPGMRSESILPDWTINEFFEQIEMFFNCVIQIDKVNLTYSIINMNDYFESYNFIYLDDVIDDDIEKIYNTETNYAYTYEYVSYDFPSDNYYNYLRLKEGVYDSCLHVYVSNISKFDTSNFDKWYNIPHVLWTSDNNLFYVVAKEKIGSQLVEKNVLRIVDSFRDSGNKDSKNKTLFKIVPEKTGRKNIWVYGGTWHFCYAVKQIRDFNFEKEDINIDDLLNGNTQLKENIPDRIYVGIYYGLQKTLWFNVYGDLGGYTNEKFPFSGVENHAVLWQQPEKPALLDLPNFSLVLDGKNGLYNNLYRNKRKIDTSVEYHFSFITNKVYDLNRIFVIRNKKYYCKEIRYKITSKGMDKVAEGVFYLAE